MGKARPRSLSESKKTKTHQSDGESDEERPAAVKHFEEEPEAKKKVAELIRGIDLHGSQEDGLPDGFSQFDEDPGAYESNERIRLMHLWLQSFLSTKNIWIFNYVCHVVLRFDNNCDQHISEAIIWSIHHFLKQNLESVRTAVRRSEEFGAALKISCINCCQLCRSTGATFSEEIERNIILIFGEYSEIHLRMYLAKNIYFSTPSQRCLEHLYKLGKNPDSLTTAFITLPDGNPTHYLKCAMLSDIAHLHLLSWDYDKALDLLESARECLGHITVSDGESDESEFYQVDIFLMSDSGNIHLAEAVLAELKAKMWLLANVSGCMNNQPVEDIGYLNEVTNTIFFSLCREYKVLFVALIRSMYLLKTNPKAALSTLHAAKEELNGDIDEDTIDEEETSTYLEYILKAAELKFFLAQPSLGSPLKMNILVYRLSIIERNPHFNFVRRSYLSPIDVISMSPSLGRRTLTLSTTIILQRLCCHGTHDEKMKIRNLRALATISLRLGEIKNYIFFEWFYHISCIKGRIQTKMNRFNTLQDVALMKNRFTTKPWPCLFFPIRDYQERYSAGGEISLLMICMKMIAPEFLEELERQSANGRWYLKDKNHELYPIIKGHLCPDAKIPSNGRNINFQRLLSHQEEESIQGEKHTTDYGILDENDEGTEHEEESPQSGPSYKIMETKQDCIGSKIRVFKPNDETTTSHIWSWPPKNEVMEFVNQFLPSNAPAIKTCFSIDQIPSSIPDVDGNEHVVAAHCLIYAPTNDLRKGCAMVQMRFDGKFGFPGGLIEPNEDFIAGLNRELEEEINLDLEKHAIRKEDFLFCHFIPNTNDEFKTSRIRLFFAKEVTKYEYEIIEKKSLDAKDFGCESLGQFRIPLYLYKHTDGFPRFLNSTCFAGGATKVQLFLALYARKLLNFEELKYVYELQGQFTSDQSI